MRTNNNRTLFMVLSVFFSFLVIFYVLSQLDWKVVRSAFSSLHWGWLLLAFFAYVLSYYFRAWRFRILLSLENVSFFHLLSVTGMYGMYNYLLPAKSGELSLVILLRNRLKISLVEGATSLVVARYFDFLAISLILPFVLVVYLNKLPLWIVLASTIFCGLVFISGIILYYFLIRSSAESRLVFHLQAFREGQFVKTLIRIRDGLIRIYQKREHFRLLLLTFAIWICVYTNFYLVVISLGYQMTYFQVIVVSIFMIPMTLLPIQGLANLGTHEIGWVAAFSIFDQPRSDALNVAVSSHIILLLFVLLLGLCSYVLSLLIQNKVT